MMPQRVVRSYPMLFLGRCLSLPLRKQANRNFWFSTDSTSNFSSEVTTTKAKRSRRRFRRIEEVPSYKDFLHRQTVLALYREFLLTVRPLSDRRELQAQIRVEFDALKNEPDNWNRNRAVKEGQRRLKDLKTTISTSVTLGSRSGPVGIERSGENNTEISKTGTGWPWERN